MCGEKDGRMRLYRAAQDADVIVVEGVMGLYDGTPSSADIAARFGLPVALVIDAAGMAQTFGKLAQGLLGDLPGAGVLANRVGSTGHAKMLKDSLSVDISWLGALPKDDRFALPERHLGLHLAAEIHDLDQRIAAAAEMLTASGDLPPLLLPMVAFECEENTPAVPPLLAGKTIAVARDEAFCFLYPANLECLQSLGAELVFFSPLHDSILPQADAVWLPGGYPELHLPQISANTPMRVAFHSAWQAGLPMLAECGGMMALTEAIDDHPAFGLLPGNTRMEKRLQGLGVQHAELPEGRLAAHTFHYSQFDTQASPIVTATSRYGAGEALYRHGSLTASYLHFYFPSNPAATAALFGGTSP
jgi:cobyrinic acid a,c-diamide synthase